MIRLNSDIYIRATSGADHELTQIQDLYREFNILHADMGMSIRMVDGGEKLWMDSMKKLLGRYAQIFVAEHNSVIIGFSAGVLRVLPPYYGSLIVGYWDSVFIRKEYRRKGIGDKMMEVLLEWWKEKGAVVAEGDRLAVNIKVKGNYERMGFHEEIIKYRKIL